MGAHARAHARTKLNILAEIKKSFDQKFHLIQQINSKPVADLEKSRTFAPIFKYLNQFLTKQTK